MEEKETEQDIGNQFIELIKAAKTKHLSDVIEEIVRRDKDVGLSELRNEDLK